MSLTDLLNAEYTLREPLLASPKHRFLPERGIDCAHSESVGTLPKWHVSDAVFGKLSANLDGAVSLTA